MKGASRFFSVAAVTLLAAPVALAAQVAGSREPRAAIAVSDAAIAPAAIAPAAIAPAIATSAIVIPANFANETERQADSALRAAKQVFQNGDYREAAQRFARLADRYPRSAQAAEALYWRAFALFRTGSQSNLAAALAALNDLNRLYPSSSANQNDAGSLRVRVCGELARRGDEAIAENGEEDQGQAVEKQEPSRFPGKEKGKIQPRFNGCPRLSHPRK